jgi:hypothetical protein
VFSKILIFLHTLPSLFCSIARVDTKVDFVYFTKYEIKTKLKFISKTFADKVLLDIFVVVRFDLKHDPDLVHNANLFLHSVAHFLLLSNFI